MHRYLSLLLFLLAAAPIAAQPYLYWTAGDFQSGTIGRAGLDGSNPDQSFIAGVAEPVGVAADGSYLYWTISDAGTGSTIGRASLDGSNVNDSFITGLHLPYKVAVDGSHLYFTTSYWSYTLWQMIYAIGRADLDGSNVNESFITGVGSPFGIAVDGSYLYWTNKVDNSIGRADLDGSNANNSFISLSRPAAGIAVGGSQIYWTYIGDGEAGTPGVIGRADLDGSNVNESFVTPANTYSVTGVAVDPTYLYWADSDNGSIGRANLDGSNANDSFITGLNYVTGVALTSDGTLPVELTSFTATLSGNAALLVWETASETNNSGFHVEHRQGEGAAFRTVGFQPGKGTTAEASRYTHAVENLTPGHHTFRLRQVDFDGASDFSPEVELSVEASGLALALYGIPATDAIRGSLSVPTSQAATVTLYDALGREVMRRDDISGAFALDVSALSSGSYVLLVEAGMKNITRAVVIAR